jgi:hypothetical protein
MSQSLLLACARTNPDATRAYLLPRPTHPELEAAWAADLVAKGEDMTELERATLAAVLQSNEDDADFNRALLDETGTEGLIDFTGLVANGAHSGDDPSIREDYARLQEGLANGIAAATQDTDSQWYDDFMTGLDEAGLRQYDVGFTDQEVRGYQLLVTTLDTGGGYSGAFLTDLANNIRAAEDPAPGGEGDSWNLHGDAIDFDGMDGERDWFALDPMDGTLGIMGRHPDTATAYLGQGDTLEYLMNERSCDYFLLETGAANPFAMPTGRAGLGLALEAGTTGREAGTQGDYGYHTPAQARLMHELINLMDADESNADGYLNNAYYDGIHQPLARALGEYAADTYDIFTGTAESGFSGDDSAYVAEDGSGRIANSRDSIIRVMRGLSTSPDNFSILYESQQGYIAERLVGLEEVDDPDQVVASWDNEGSRVGEVYGIMNGIGADIVLDERDASISDTTDAMRYGPQASGAILGFIPQAGALANRVIELGAFEWSKSVNADTELWARGELSGENMEAQDQLRARIIDGWATERGIEESEGAEHLWNEAQDSYASGRENAYAALRSGS